MTIQQGSGEPIHLSIDEAKEIVSFLSGELMRVLPEFIEMKKQGEVYVAESVRVKNTATETVYEPGPRTATQTHEVKVGDPNLAYKYMGGRTNFDGDGQAGTIDLGALAEKVGKF